ncbi:unnamed protein product [Candidula unifasciata]|uniref:G-protein coupled receptors family 1 profile domain-containing protein n=1 Tax=Candidula unifasciata TaxID=100452 RepID=A0A8S4A150_9EUPU|nr:unnamed protein product [Candidula unifasciata]
MSVVFATSVLISLNIGAMEGSSKAELFIDTNAGGGKQSSGANSSNTSLPVSEEERRRYIAELQRETTKTMIPALVFLATLAVVGLVGNSLVIIVYSRKFHLSATATLIITAAWLDLFANVTAIPGEMYNMLHKWDFDNPILCNARFYCSAFPTISSAMILVALAVVRYRKVCHPHKWQVTEENAKVISAVIPILGALFAIPHAILGGTQTKETPHGGIVGYTCSIDDRYKKTKLPLFSYALLLLFYIDCSITLIALYTLIGLTARRHKRLYGVSVPGTAYTTSKYDTNADEFTSDQNRSNCIICGSPTKKSAGSPMNSESTLQDSSRLGNINLKRFYYAPNEANRVPVQYEIRVFPERIEIRTPTVKDFFVKLQNTNPGVAEIASYGKGIRSDTTRTTDETMNTCRSQNISVKTNLLFDKSVHNLNGTDIDTHSQSASTQIAASEFSNESDPLSDFKWLDIVYCPDDGHNTFCSNCIQRETSISFRLPLNNSLLQTIEWLRSSVIEALTRQDDTTRKTSDFLRASITPIDKSQINSNTTRTFSGNATKITAPLDLHPSFLRRRFHIPIFRRVSLINVGGYPACKRPTGRTTTMLVLLSAFYIIGYLPHLAIMIVRLLVPRVIKNLSFVGNIFYNVVARSYLVNCAVNPIIYSLCDSNFRRECIQMFKRFNVPEI